MRRIVASCWLLASASLLFAAEPDLKVVPAPIALLVPEAKLQVAAGVCFLEGPAVDAEGSVFFSDIAGNRILKQDAKGNLSVFRADSGRTNGNTFDAQG